MSIAEPVHPKQRIDWLDSLRGLAAVFVMALHYFHLALLAIIPTIGHFQTKPPQDLETQSILETLALLRGYLDTTLLEQLNLFVFGYYDLGKVGVALFFLVSGFVIPCSLFKAHKPLQQFFLSRVFRLYPIYWVSLGFIIAFHLTPIVLSPLTILANLTMFQGFFRINDINSVSWTLQIEWAFYLLCVGLSIFGFLKPKKANYISILCLWTIALGLAYVRFQTGSMLPVAMPLGLSLMMMGYVWRKRLLGEETIPTPHLWVGLSLFSIVLSAICFWAYQEAFWRYIVTYSLALVLFIGLTTRFRLHHAAFRFLGAISYSLYLIHAIIGKPLLTLIISTSPGLYQQHSELILLPIATSMLIAIGVSAITYYIIEQPCLQLGKRLQTKWYASPVAKVSQPLHAQALEGADRPTIQPIVAKIEAL